MSFQVSPGVQVSEIDLTTVVPAVSTTEGAIVGTWKWGPIETRVLIDGEDDLVERFGKPSDLNAETFFTAANFLAYGKALYVTRVSDSSSLNAVSDKSSVTTGVLVKNEDAFEAGEPASKRFVARYAGELGNSLRVSICDTSDKYYLANVNSGQITALAVGSDTATLDTDYTDSGAPDFYENVQPGDKLDVSGQIMQVKSINSTAAIFTSTYKGSAAVSNLPIRRYWKHYNLVDRAPGTSEWTKARHSNTSIQDEIHVVVEDGDGGITGVPGTILEVWEGLSRATDAKTEDGSSAYYKTVVNNLSEWVYTVDHASANINYSNTATNLLAVDDIATGEQNEYQTLANGADSAAEGSLVIGDVTPGLDMYADGAEVDVSLIMMGKALGGTNGEAAANYAIDNIAEIRKDTVVFVSPDRADVVNNSGSELTDVETFRNSLSSSSYAFMDSGYKYQYDKYNDVYRWIPLNGDIAGIAARSDNDRDPWWSPAGFNRGHVKNIVRLAWNPSKAQQDSLYKRDVNPVVTVQGQGTVLHGDKTLLGKPSAFSRVNVRRLFIVLEKAIAKAAQFTLFEFNDEFTRSQFRNLIEPFLRDVQGRRGIVDFRVVVDETNNTQEVIDGNRFVGDIYVKPNASINFIQLNFVAVRSGVEFSEIVGQF